MSRCDVILVTTAFLMVCPIHTVGAQRRKSTAKQVKKGNDEPIYAPFCSRVVVIDSTGEKHSVTSPRFQSSDEYEKDYENGYLQFTVSRLPRRDFWIHTTFVKEVSFSKGKSRSELLIRGTLFNGRTFSGQFAKPSLMLTGKGKLGDVKIPVSEIKTIEFVDFQQLVGSEGIHLDSSQTTEAWQRWRNYRNNKTLGKWQITDGDFAHTSPEIMIWNVYQSNKYSIWQSYGTMFKIADFLEEKWPLKKGASDAEVALCDVERFEFTGMLSDGRPNVVVTKTDGTKVIATLSLPDVKNSQACAVDTGDMLAWHFPHGFVGTSILPSRQIVIQRAKDIPRVMSETKEARTGWPFEANIPDGFAFDGAQIWQGRNLWILKGRRFENAYETIIVVQTDSSKISLDTYRAAYWAAEICLGCPLGSCTLKSASESFDMTYKEYDNQVIHCPSHPNHALDPGLSLPLKSFGRSDTYVPSGLGTCSGRLDGTHFVIGWAGRYEKLFDTRKMVAAFCYDIRRRLTEGSRRDLPPKD